MALFLVGLIVGIVMLYLYMRYFEKDNITYIDYGDSFENYSAKTMNQNSIVLENKGINVYFYLSDSCDSCLEILDLYKDLSNIKLYGDVKYFCLWENDIPVNKIKKMKIDADNIISLQGKYKFNSVKPYFFIVKDEMVDFATQDYTEVIDRVLSYYDTEELKKSIFVNKFSGDEIKSKALIFVSEETKNIKINDLNYKDCFFVADYRDEDMYYDEYGIYKKIFEINEYPTAVCWNGFSFEKNAIENSY